MTRRRGNLHRRFRPCSRRAISRLKGTFGEPAIIPLKGLCGSSVVVCGNISFAELFRQRALLPVVAATSYPSSIGCTTASFSSAVSPSPGRTSPFLLHPLGTSNRRRSGLMLPQTHSIYAAWVCRHRRLRPQRGQGFSAGGTYFMVNVRFAVFGGNTRWTLPILCPACVLAQCVSMPKAHSPPGLRDAMAMTLALAVDSG